MPLTPQEACLETTAEKIARIITRQYGVEVRVEGGRAYYDPDSKVIVLPELTKLQLEKVAGVLDGFLDHECAHVLFTDPTPARGLSAEVKNILNAIEDVWVEREMGQRYLGCGENLETLWEAHRKFIDEAMKTKTGDVLNKLLLAFMSCWKGKARVEDFDSYPDIGELWKFLRPEYLEGCHINNTWKATELAKKIWEKIGSLIPPPPSSMSEESGEKKDGDEDEGDEDEEGEGEGGGGGDSKKKKSGEDDDGDGGDESDEGEDDEGEDDESEDGKKSKGKSRGGGEDKDGGADDGDGDEDEDGDGDENDEDESGDGGSDGDSSGDTKGEKESSKPEVAAPGVGKAGREAAKRFLEQSFSEDDRLTDAEALVNSLLKPPEETGDEPEEYHIFSTEFDRDHNFEPEERISYSARYKALKDSIYEYVGSMATSLELALTIESESRMVGGARRGRHWDKRHMPQWFLGGNDDRVFLQKVEGVKWDTAVTLLWDCSGSMGNGEGSKSALARLAAIAFHEALTKAHIEHEVLGFTTLGDCPPGLLERVANAENRGESLERYSRLDDIDDRMVFVPFGSTDGRAICHIHGGYDNRDGEAVLWAAKRLAARPEKRKILIVGSDGQPYGARYHYTEQKFLQESVQRVIESGIEVYAIGIMDESVEEYYPQFVLLKKAADLPRVVVQQLSDALLQRKGTNPHGSFSGMVRKKRR